MTFGRGDADAGSLLPLWAPTHTDKRMTEAIAPCSAIVLKTKLNTSKGSG